MPGLSSAPRKGPRVLAWYSLVRLQPAGFPSGQRPLCNNAQSQSRNPVTRPHAGTLVREHCQGEGTPVRTPKSGIATRGNLIKWDCSPSRLPRCGRGRWSGRLTASWTSFKTQRNGLNPPGKGGTPPSLASTTLLVPRRGKAFQIRPRVRGDYPPNLSILLSGGKETNSSSKYMSEICPGSGRVG